MSGYDAKLRAARSVTPPEREIETPIQGQKHDRIPDDIYLTGPPEPAYSENGDVDISAGQKMLSAMSGSLLTSLIVTPLDVVRVRLQSQPSSSMASIQQLASATPRPFAIPATNLGVTACCREVFFINNHAKYCVATPNVGNLGFASATSGAECAAEEIQKRAITSTFDGLRKIARNEGITTLWRGLSPTLLMTVPANIIYFTGYDWMRFNKASPVTMAVPDNYAPLVAGSFARIVAAVVVSPIEMFRTRMQASTSVISTGHLSDTFADFRDMVKMQGYTSLWRGLTLTLWRDVPFSGMYWWGYETIKGRLTDAREKSRGRSMLPAGAGNRPRTRSQSRENHTATFTDSFIAGAVSGAIASVLTTPFDVGKTRQQVFREQPMSSSTAKRVLAPEERSMPRFLWHIFKTEGVSGLWRGWIPRTLKVAPACAIMISSYELGKRMAVSNNERAARKKEAI